MTARVAVATARYGDPWDELSVLASRLAGALACSADVDVLIPSAESTGAAAEVGWDGACRLLRFPATPVDRRRRAAWRKVALGIAGDAGPGACSCPTATNRRRLPRMIEEELVLADGGDSPAFYAHLRRGSYDVTLFVGLHTPVTCFGMRELPEERRAFVAPGRHDAADVLKVHDTALARAERILVCTESERLRMVDRMGPGGTDRVENIGFLVGVNTVVRPATAAGDPHSHVVVARDWRTPASLAHYVPWAERLARCLPAGVDLRLVGPGAGLFPAGVPHTDARIDAWWWMSRALTVIDPVPHRILGQEVLEAMLLGVPVVVAANGDASREHAECGNGGLWYRIDDEMVASIARLRDSQTGASLGERGRSYAESHFSDTDTYVKRVTEAILGGHASTAPDNVIR